MPGVAFDTGATNLILFGVSTWGDWSTPTDVAFNIYVDFDDRRDLGQDPLQQQPGHPASALFGNTAATGLDAFTNAVLNIRRRGQCPRRGRKLREPHRRQLASTRPSSTTT